MVSDNEVFEMARQARDPRFDGRFFVGVVSTGIYCRPVCPVRIPKRENVILYPTAAAAAQAGLRPCLRCRPETSPGTPAWLGSSYTVSRALQLINQGEPRHDSAAMLASELGITSRQLCRLFRKHLGASPKAVMLTRRLHFAKQLLDETDLPISEICFASGFGSIRRFNDVIRTSYGTSPTRLRRGGKSQSGQEGICIRLNYRPPFDWRTMLKFFALRAIPGVESVAATGYRRSFGLEGVSGHLQLEFAGPGNSARLRIFYPDSSRLLQIVERVRQQFDLRADSARIDSYLSSADPQLAAIIASCPGIRVPGSWDGLEIAVRAIVGQQVSVQAATTLMGRLVARTGVEFPEAVPQSGGVICRLFPGAARLADADLTGLGITAQRIAAIQSLARSVADGELEFDGIVDPGGFSRKLCLVRGIGEWTAQYIALRALRDPDAFPHGDLILRRALTAGAAPLSPRRLLTRAEPWRPWRAYAVMLLWRHYQRETHRHPTDACTAVP